MATRLQKKAKRGFRGYPIATIAIYGPTDLLATKVAVAVFRAQGEDPTVLERFFPADGDVRYDAAVEQQILDLLRAHDVRSVILADRLIGCPHEEGVDYPEGKSCPQCPFWAGRDHWSGDRIQ